jgi:hypothetical protein
MSLNSPTKPVDLEERVAGDSWDVVAVINGDATVAGVVVFMTIKRSENLPDPGYAQRRSDQSGVVVGVFNGTSTTVTFSFTRTETDAMREAAGESVWYDIAVFSSGGRKTTTQRGRIPIALDITQTVP